MVMTDVVMAQVGDPERVTKQLVSDMFRLGRGQRFCTDALFGLVIDGFGDTFRPKEGSSYGP